MGTREIGIFALGTVLAPGELLPLHIFEERYKQLIGDSLESGDPFLLLYSDDDGTRELGCAASVIEVLQRYDDGRMNIVVEGGDLLRVVEMTRGKAYATGMVEDAADDTRRRRRARRRAASSTATFATAAGLETEDDDLESHERPLSYLIMARVDFPAAEKQRILELRSERDRLMAIVDLLGRGLQSLAADRADPQARADQRQGSARRRPAGRRRARRPRHPLAALVVANLRLRRRLPRQRGGAPRARADDAGRAAVPGRGGCCWRRSRCRRCAGSRSRQTAAPAVDRCAGLWRQMVLIYLRHQPGERAIAAIIVGLEPVLIAVWAALLLHERFGGRRAAGLAVGLAGSLLVAGVGAPRAPPGGRRLLLPAPGSSFSWYTVASKRHLPPSRRARADRRHQRAGRRRRAGADDRRRDRCSDSGSRPRRADLADRALPGRRQQRDRLRRSGTGRWPGCPQPPSAPRCTPSRCSAPGSRGSLLRDPLPPTFLPGAALVLPGVYIASSARRAAAAATLRARSRSSRGAGRPRRSSAPSAPAATALAPPK